MCIFTPTYMVVTEKQWNRWRTISIISCFYISTSQRKLFIKEGFCETESHKNPLMLRWKRINTFKGSFSFEVWVEQLLKWPRLFLVGLRQGQTCHILNCMFDYATFITLEYIVLWNSRDWVWYV